MIKGTYDPEANAAYIYLADESRPEEVAFCYPCDPIGVQGMINLDFDGEGRLIGIEVLGARSKLHPDSLEQLRRIGD